MVVVVVMVVVAGVRYAARHWRSTGSCCTLGRPALTNPTGLKTRIENIGRWRMRREGETAERED